jgi:hypothetical protein
MVAPLRGQQRMDPMHKRMLALAVAMVLALTAAVPAFAEGAAPATPPGCAVAEAQTAGTPGFAAVTAHCGIP